MKSKRNRNTVACRCFVAAGIGLLAWATLPADAATPATAPSSSAATTAPATSAAFTSTLDQSSPKSLLRTFFASHGELNEAQIRSLYHATTPIEQKALDGVVQVELANQRLRAVEHEKFARAATRPASAGVTPLDPETLGELDSLIERIDGDNATVSAPKAPGLSMYFVKVQGKWKLPIAALVGRLDPGMVETMDAVTRAQVGVIDGITADVRAGRLTSEQQVRDELKRRLAQRLAAAGHNNPAMPTTSPEVAPRT